MAYDGLLEVCRSCGTPGVTTINTRPHRLGKRRRRECPTCSARWSTIEIPIEWLDALVAADGLDRLMDGIPALLESLKAMQELRRKFAAARD